MTLAKKRRKTSDLSCPGARAPRLAENCLNHQELSDVIGRQDAYQVTAVLNGQGPATRLLQERQGIFQHIVRIRLLNVAAHPIADESFRATLRQGLHQVLASQDAQHVTTQDHGKVLLPAGQEVFNGRALSPGL